MDKVERTGYSVRFVRKNLIYGPGPYVIKFVLNATVNWVKTPDTLKLWGYKKEAYCCLCGHNLCTLHHIISNCSFALEQKRYTWRHDSVLLNLKPVLQDVLDTANKKCIKRNFPPISTSFTPAGSSPKKQTQRRTTLLDGADDWKFLIDFDHEKILFPPEIYATPERPDIIIWSMNKKSLILVELTCPAEEGILPAQERKEARYFPLRCNIKDFQTSWSVELMTIEIGARGYVANTLPRCLKRLGCSPRQVKRVCKDISSIVARCTYAIYLSHDQKLWEKNRKLLSLERASTAPPNPTLDGNDDLQT
jgi:hypothetical protein